MLKKGTAFLLLLCLCGLLLAGCRESPALQDIVYNQDNAEDVSQVDSLINNEKDALLLSVIYFIVSDAPATGTYCPTG